MNTPLFKIKIPRFPNLRVIIKTLFTLILLTQFPSISKTQDDYIPLAVEGAQWIVNFDDVKTIWPVDGLWEYYAEGDTNISGKTYKKIYHRQLVVTQDPPPFEPIGEYELKGFIRDDTIEKKAYAIDLDIWNNFCPSDEEFLMFDFGVNQLDTVDFCLLPEYNTYVIDTIYQETFIGFETKRFRLVWDFDSYFEGLGSSYGLFELLFWPVDDNNHITLGHTSLYYYCREAPCGLIVSVPEERISRYDIQIYPNPTQDILHIKLRNDKTKGEVHLFNIYGQELKQFQFEGKMDEYYLDISDLSAGSYILVFSIEGVIHFSKKLIVTL